MGFNDQVWEAIKKIPGGRVATYSGIATYLGKPGAARAVGNACNANPLAPGVPCHRVVQSNGLLGGYAHGSKAKKTLLEKEGLKIVNGRIVDFEKNVFKPAGKP